MAACNPHRGNSLASHKPKKSWLRGSYYVHPIHPTLQLLKWDYGSLDEHQEKDYIIAKMIMINETVMSQPEVSCNLALHVLLLFAVLCRFAVLLI